MIQRKLIDYLQRHPEKMARRWMEKVRQSEHMEQYNTLNDAELIRRGMTLFEHLGRWLDHSVSRNEIGRYFVTVGQERFDEQFPLCELNYAIYLEKKVFWEFVQSEGILINPVQMMRAMELITAIGEFFDLGNFYLARGYLASMYLAIKKSGRLSPGELEKFFFPGSFLSAEDEFSNKFQYFPFFESSRKPDIY
ncbi:MAG: hypothetical protein JXQ27_11300 [Acidobacteria bacterium]|nr:hypothetical protein [Acidobacteriota bacterium]